MKFRGLLIASLLLSASHPLLDWTNNYGLRPFLPWSGEWFYGDLVFIVDPYIWLLVGGAAFLLTSGRAWQKVAWAVLALGLTGLVLFMPLETGGMLYPNVFRVLWIAGVFGLFIMRVTKLGSRADPRVAAAALALVVVYWAGLSFAHRSALYRAEVVARALAGQNGERLGRFAAMPVLADPFRWMCVADTEKSTYRFIVSLSGSDGEAAGRAVRFLKPLGGEAEAVAKASLDERAQVFLNFARFPASKVEGDCMSGLLVQFADLRYTEPGASRRGTFSLDVPTGCEAETKGADEN